jgi:hypothetical protein
MVKQHVGKGVAWPAAMLDAISLLAAVAPAPDHD